jgi:hypothetical protein
MAARLRRETTLTIRQTAQRLGRLEKPQQQALPAQQNGIEGAKKVKSHGLPPFPFRKSINLSVQSAGELR